MSERIDNSIGTFSSVLNVWNRHEKKLRSYLIHRVGDVHTADDLLQEVFLKSMRQGAGFCQLGNPRAWLFQVARNAFAHRIRLAWLQTELPKGVAAPQSDARAPTSWIFVSFATWGFLPTMTENLSSSATCEASNSKTSLKRMD